jgi:7,8-dihydropterin-6-yl-methyl-4-(beta-D-ribofuranosyl)aminobenzene 5'-phosphate synthase
MYVTILTENTKLTQSKLNAEHGLSLLIEKEEKKVLFDTGGPKGTAIQNAKTLNLDLSGVDAVVISHGHNDHTGGLLDFFKLNDNAPVYLKKEALNYHYTGKSINKEFIGMDVKIIDEYKDRLKFVDGTSEILDDFFIIPEINKTFPTPSTNRILFSKEGNQFFKDKFDHELFLGVKNNSGLTLFSGCGHSNIKNIVVRAKEVFPDTEIKNIIGGFHFQAGEISTFTAKKEEIEETSLWIKFEGVEKVYTGHCTGKYGLEIMHSILNEGVKQFYTGKRITI